VSGYGAQFDWLAQRWAALESEHDKIHPDRDQCGGVGGCSMMLAAHRLETELVAELDKWRCRTLLPSCSDDSPVDEDNGGGLRRRGEIVAAVREARTEHGDDPGAIFDAVREQYPDVSEDTVRRTLARLRQPMANPVAGIVYALDVRDPGSGDIVLGYVGQTRQGLSARMAAHRLTQTWGDTIISGRVLEEFESISNQDLLAAEAHYIAELEPIHNRLKPTRSESPETIRERMVAAS